MWPAFIPEARWKYIPDVNKTLNTTISLISQSIDPTTRGFIAEARIPTDPVLKPNQSAVIKIMDYAAPNAVVIPVNVVQADESGKYVYVVETAGNKQVAKRNPLSSAKFMGMGGSEVGP